MKEEDVKYTGQELGQVLDDQFNSGGVSSLTQCGHQGCIWAAACFPVMG